MYENVAIYTLDGTFLGFSIKDPAATKLQTTNIYAEGEEQQLQAQTDRLNAAIDLRTFWPHPQDPEVTALLDDSAFLPIEYEDAEVVDDDHSHYVWKLEPETDEHGNPTGRMVQGSELDELASVITYKMAKVPKRPSDVMYRVKRACEQVARSRAGLG